MDVQSPKKDDITRRPLAREQAYLCLMAENPDPPKGAPKKEALRQAHKNFLVDLERRGLLFGAGRLINEEGGETTELGYGLFILRAATRGEAEAVAFEEPFTKAGLRRMTLHPWQRNEGNVSLSIRFLDSVLEIDYRTYDLVPRKG